MRIALIVLVACGSRTVPMPIVMVRESAKPKPPPAPMTCGDAGVILRGPVADPVHGPTKEALIASACLHDKWSSKALECVGSDVAPTECFVQLDEPQRASLAKLLQAWSFETGEPFNSIDVGHVEKVVATDCATGIGAVEAYTPALALQGEELAFATELRRVTIDALCRAGWPEPVKQCFASREPTDVCRTRLAQNLRLVVTDQIARLEATIALVLATRAKPVASYDCKQVVAVHYSDAAWNASLPIPKDPKTARARKQMIDARRAAMTAACLADGWNATMRACIVSGSGTQCFRAGRQNPDRWGFQ